MCIIQNIIFDFSAGCITDTLVPLYIYPAAATATAAEAWAPLYQAISAAPAVTFYVIINPASGPGSLPCPDDNYIMGITKLKAYTNVVMVGYVATTYAARNQALVFADILAYNKWAKPFPGGCDLPGINGIFFDEVLSDSASLAYYTAINTAVKVTYKDGLGLTKVFLNPGVSPEPSYFPIADSIVVFENVFAQFVNYPIVADGVARAKKTMIAHDFLYSGSASVQSAITQVRQAGRGVMYLTELPEYWQNLPSILTELAQYLAVTC